MSDPTQTPPQAPPEDSGPEPPPESLDRELRALLVVFGAIALLAALYGMAFAPKG